MKTGIDNLKKYLHVFEGKRVGLITNPTGIGADYVSTIDILRKETNLTALFAPEHGIRGNIRAGEKINTYTDEKTGITVYSLYGSSHKPSPEVLDKLDVMAIDLLDAGSRHYTFIYTMAHAMEACAAAKKQFVVFDRPNPALASVCEGNLLDLSYRSFIGYYPLVQRHGMTIGEIALLFNEEYGIGCDLTVIPMEGYRRDMSYKETGCLWVMPSPNLPSPLSVLVYNATCVFEGTNISEGRGTTAPFEIIGAPFIDPDQLSARLNGYGFKNVYFRPLFFTPMFDKYKGEICGGVQLHVLDGRLEGAVSIGWTILEEIRTLWPDCFRVNDPSRPGGLTMLELNTGCEYIKTRQYTLSEQMEIIRCDTEKFMKIREKYLLY